MINLTLVAATLQTEITGIVDNDAAMPFIQGAYGVTAALLIGLGVYTYKAMTASAREADRLNPRKQNKDKSE